MKMKKKSYESMRQFVCTYTEQLSCVILFGNAFYLCAYLVQCSKVCVAGHISANHIEL